MVTGTFTGKQMQRFPVYADHNLAVTSGLRQNNRVRFLAVREPLGAVISNHPQLPIMMVVANIQMVLIVNRADAEIIATFRAKKGDT